MPSPFDAFDAALQSAVGGAFGESIQVTPRIASQYSALQNDPERPMRIVRGVFSFVAVTMDISGQRVGAQLGGTTQFAHSNAEAWISAAEYLTLGYAVRKNDVIVLPDMPGDPRYAVTHVAATDQGDVTLFLALENQ